MIQQIFQRLGLSKTEAKAYAALLELKEAKVEDIASAISAHKRNTYDAISRLIDKGLVFPIITKEGYAYCGVDPDKLMELTKEKEAKLAEILPVLKQRYATDKGKQ